MLEEDAVLPIDIDGKHTQYYSHAPPNSAMIHRQTDKFREFTVFDGTLYGTYKEWSPSGSLLIRSNFINGVLDGKYEEWYEGFYQHGPDFGKPFTFPKIRAFFSDGSPRKKIETFYPSGNLKTVTHADNTGLLHGYVIEFFDDKRNPVKMSVQYVHGRRTGYAFKKFANGNKHVSANFLDDELHGEYERFYPTGISRVRCVFKKGKLDGKYVLRYQDDSVQRLLKFTDGKLNGGALFLWKTNKPKTACSFVRGHLHGPYRQYDESGKLILERKYNMGDIITSTSEAEI